MSLKYPIDDDGFAIPSTNLEFDMHKYGIIVHAVLNEQEALLSQNALWRHMGPKVTSDYKTWETMNWPQGESPFLSTDYAIDEQAFCNRIHPNLIHAFSQLFNTTNLLTTIDFYGIKRGTLFRNKNFFSPAFESCFVMNFYQ